MSLRLKAAASTIRTASGFAAIFRSMSLFARRLGLVEVFRLFANSNRNRPLKGMSLIMRAVLAPMSARVAGGFPCPQT